MLPQQWSLSCEFPCNMTFFCWGIMICLFGGGTSSTPLPPGSDPLPLATVCSQSCPIPIASSSPLHAPIPAWGSYGCIHIFVTWELIITRTTGHLQAFWVTPLRYHNSVLILNILCRCLRTSTKLHRRLIDYKVCLHDHYKLPANFPFLQAVYWIIMQLGCNENGHIVKYM